MELAAEPDRLQGRAGARGRLHDGVEAVGIYAIGYEDEDSAVRIANETPYGLAGYVSGSIEGARRVGRRLRVGNVNLNGAPLERGAPFGGYKQSGNGREWGRFGLEEYLEVKAVAGWGS